MSGGKCEKECASVEVEDEVECECGCRRKEEECGEKHQWMTPPVTYQVLIKVVGTGTLSILSIVTHQKEIIT